MDPKVDFENGTANSLGSAHRPRGTGGSTNTIDFNGLELFPALMATDRVNLLTLMQRPQAANQAVVTALSKQNRVSNILQPLPSNTHPLVMRAAITGVSAVTGCREQNTEVRPEYAHSLVVSKSTALVGQEN
ncbi:hypothetical protein CFII68_14086 [Pseudomonas sp. CFII68]|nr:hypothetical protein CFII68_14086 [Pseudomonas sp. CFII68]